MVETIKRTMTWPGSSVERVFSKSPGCTIRLKSNGDPPVLADISDLPI